MINYFSKNTNFDLQHFDFTIIHKMNDDVHNIQLKTQYNAKTFQKDKHKS